MEYATLLLTLAVVDLLAAMSPGPNFVLVADTAMRHSRRSAAAVVAGFVLSNFVWCAAVVLGLASLFRAAPWVYGALKVLGGAYLINLGAQLWLRNPQRSETAAVLRSHNQAAALLRGMLTNLSNPKSVIYFSSVFALFLGPGTPLWVQVAAIGIVLANTAAWYGSVALFFSSATVHRAYRGIERVIDRVAGAFMAAFGVRLLFARE